jgi:hypothetical protein
MKKFGIIVLVLFIGFIILRIIPAVINISLNPDLLKTDERKIMEALTMNKELFWTIIEESKDNDTEIMYANLAEKLNALPDNEAKMFSAYLDAYGSRETIWLDMACQLINGTTDDSVYSAFMFWLIAQGETVFLQALSDPDSLAELPEIPFGNAKFETLRSLSRLHYGTGRDVDEMLLYSELAQKAHIEIITTTRFKDPPPSGLYETDEDAVNDIPNVLPKLFARAEEAGFGVKTEKVFP